MRLARVAALHGIYPDNLHGKASVNLNGMANVRFRRSGTHLQALEHSKHALPATLNHAASDAVAGPPITFFVMTCACQLCKPKKIKRSRIRLHALFLPLRIRRHSTSHLAHETKEPQEFTCPILFTYQCLTSSCPNRWPSAATATCFQKILRLLYSSSCSREVLKLADILARTH